MLAECGGKVVVDVDPQSDSGSDGSGETGSGTSTGGGSGMTGSGGITGTGGAAAGLGGGTTGGAAGSRGGSGGAGGSSDGGPSLRDVAPSYDADSIDGDSGQRRKRIAFSRGASNGNLGGLAGADRFCQNAALAGVWKAWLSDSTTNAIDRIADVGPWYTMNGLLAFENKAQLAQTPSAIIEFDQHGGVVAASSYWTGTRVGGTSTDANCNNWTSANDVGVWGDGRQLKGASTWTEASPPNPCINAINLLCIEH